MRFAVLEHTGWPGHADHYDLLLQVAAGVNDDDPVLLTFSTAELVFPIGRPDLLHRKANHRKAYLHIEGVRALPDKGQVKNRDCGELRWLSGPDTFYEKRLFQLSGGELRGTFSLQKLGEQYVFMRETQAAEDYIS
jgi:hypothetical protein